MFLFFKFHPEFLLVLLNFALDIVQYGLENEEKNNQSNPRLFLTLNRDKENAIFLIDYLFCNHLHPYLNDIRDKRIKSNLGL